MIVSAALSSRDRQNTAVRIIESGIQLKGADQEDPGPFAQQPMGADQPPGARKFAPVAVWTAGALYYTYFVGEMMRMFDVCDVVLMYWSRGILEVTESRSVEAVRRLHRKRERRVPFQERSKLYKRVFNFGQPEEQIRAVNETFPDDWARLMKGVAAYVEHNQQGNSELSVVSRTLIEQATRELQYSLSAAMAGTTYLMAAEVYTFLRETMDLLKSEEILYSFGSSEKGILGLVDQLAAEHFHADVRAPWVNRLAESGSRILQDWVARYNGEMSTEAEFAALLRLSQEWTQARVALSGHFDAP